MSISASGVSPEFATIAQLYDTSSMLLGEVLQMEKRPTKKGAIRVRKLLNEIGKDVKLAKKDFKEFTMEKFGVKEDPELVESAKRTSRCSKCGLFLSKESIESNVVICDQCGSEPYESREDPNAPNDSTVES